MTVTRRLAAILAADIASYSRLMGEDEAGTARALRERRSVADPLVAEHGGRIVKTTGDRVLIESPRADTDLLRPNPRRALYAGSLRRDLLDQARVIVLDVADVSA